MDRSDTWDGGYKRLNSKGKKVFVIYKRVSGKLWEISTRCISSSAAEIQYRRFQGDPENFKPGGDKPRGALLLDFKLGESFLHWSRDEKHNSPKWRRDQKRALTWWEKRIGGVDLRKLTTERVVSELQSVKRGRKQLIATLKTFFAWLRTERHAITTAEDPTYGQLKVPQSKPMQMTRPKAVDRAEFERVLSQLTGWPRDALEVLGATGWHVSELQRFIATGAVEAHPQNGEPVLLCPHTKGGTPLVPRSRRRPAMQRCASKRGPCLIISTCAGSSRPRARRSNRGTCATRWRPGRSTRAPIPGRLPRSSGTAAPPPRKSFTQRTRCP